MKYQFCIRFHRVDMNSAASKAVLDCNRIFSRNGYFDYTFTVNDNADKKRYYCRLLKGLAAFFFGVKRHSIVAIQYPLLSINNVFKYFIRVARLKKVKFFCIVHDIESLRTGGNDPLAIAAEVRNLNSYDVIIVHNKAMKQWLSMAGVTKPMVTLCLFDYLSDDFSPSHGNLRTIIYAGNLAKSSFIYQFPAFEDISLLAYGPGFDKGRLNGSDHIKWAGEFSPEQILRELKGGFGLIWDGPSTHSCEDVHGHYLKYNNPHKLSLYIAAGLPVIAPRQSAIGKIIIQHHIGILVDTLADLQTLDIKPGEYELLRHNVLILRSKVINGGFFEDAISVAEYELNIKPIPA